MEKSLQEHHALAPPDEALGQNCGRFKGIRMRKWGKWVSEIRMPKSREKIWLGSYKTAEQAARAYDAAGYCLRGLTAKRNFPSSVPDIPSASSLSRKQIQVAAAKYALDEIPSTSPSLHNIKSNNNNNKAREKPASPSRPSSVSETNLTCDNQQISEEQNLGFCESPFDGNGGGLKLDKIPSIDEMSAALDLNFPVHGGYPYIFLESINGNGGGLKLDKIPSINEMSAELDLNFPVQEAYPYIFLESTELWNFGDVCGTLETFE